jgi:antitoxin HicB
MLYTYKIQLHKEPEGGFTVTVPLLPGCVTYGENMDEAVEMAKEAIGLYLESLTTHGEKIPTEENVYEHIVSIAV